MLNQSYCKFLKLLNGEEIIVTTDNDCSDFKKEKYLFVVDPVEVKTISLARGPMVVETHVMQPWIRLAKRDIIQIPTDNILIAVDVEDDVLNQYSNFLSKEEPALSTSDPTVQDLMNEMFGEEEDDEDLEVTPEPNKEGKLLH